MTLVREIMAEAMKHGYKAYTINNSDEYGFLITPNGNVLHVGRATWGNGVVFSLEYKPSRRCGSGCSCHDDDDYDWGFTKVTIKGLEDFEKAGLKFARELKAPMYRNPEEWIADKQKFLKGSLQEVTV